MLIIMILSSIYMEIVRLFRMKHKEEAMGIYESVDFPWLGH